jgi:hypothetical protein
MKAGDIVICVNNKNTDLVVGQRYVVYREVETSLDDMPRIRIVIDDAHILNETYYSHRFKPLNREKKLERILK